MNHNNNPTMLIKFARTNSAYFFPSSPHSSNEIKREKTSPFDDDFKRNNSSISIILLYILPIANSANNTQPSDDAV